MQDARKAAGLEVSDHIALKLTVPAGDVAKVEQFRDLVSADTLADSLDVVAGAEAPSSPSRLPRPDFGWGESVGLIPLGRFN